MLSTRRFPETRFWSLEEFIDLIKTPEADLQILTIFLMIRARLFP